MKIAESELFKVVNNNGVVSLFSVIDETADLCSCCIYEDEDRLTDMHEIDDIDHFMTVIDLHETVELVRLIASVSD